MTEGEAAKLVSQVKETLIELAKKAGEDVQIFERCLNLAFRRVSVDASVIFVPLFAEKRYEHVTGQLCWVFGFARLRQERDEPTSFLSFPSLLSVLWVAVRFRFPQKAWPTYLAIEPENALRSLFLIVVIVAGYVAFLKVLRYAFDRWF